MHYNRARYYNQSIGRFSQMDSWQGKDCTPITLNKYVYANAAPTMFTDPSGNITIAGVMAGLNGHSILQNQKQVSNIRQVQNLVANLCKTTSQLAGGKLRDHHALPVFMGNTRKGNRGEVEVDRYIHDQLHTLIELNVCN